MLRCLYSPQRPFFLPTLIFYVIYFFGFYGSFHTTKTFFLPTLIFYVTYFFGFYGSCTDHKDLFFYQLWSSMLHIFWDSTEAFRPQRLFSSNSDHLCYIFSLNSTVAFTPQRLFSSNSDLLCYIFSLVFTVAFRPQRLLFLATLIRQISPFAD